VVDEEAVVAAVVVEEAVVEVVVGLAGLDPPVQEETVHHSGFGAGAPLQTILESPMFAGDLPNKVKKLLWKLYATPLYDPFFAE